MRDWPVARDVLLFCGGLAGVIHETVAATAERPTLLILFAAMMGLPAFLQKGGPPGPPSPPALPSQTGVQQVPTQNLTPPNSDHSGEPMN